MEHPTPTRVLFSLLNAPTTNNILAGQVLMEEDRFMVCCLDTVEECNNYGHPFNTDGWTGVRVAEMVRGNTNKTQLAKSGQIVETLGSIQVMQEKFPVEGL